MSLPVNCHTSNDAFILLESIDTYGVQRVTPPHLHLARFTTPSILKYFPLCLCEIILSLFFLFLIDCLLSILTSSSYTISPLHMGILQGSSMCPHLLYSILGDLIFSMAAVKLWQLPDLIHDPKFALWALESYLTIDSFIRLFYR